jgi:hypothetical protein
MVRRAGIGGLLGAVAVLAAACSPQLDWRELRSQEGGFVAVLPGKPTLEERELSGAHGALMHMWSARSGGAVYGVGYVDAPDAGPELVARTRDALAANIAGRLVEDREFTQGAARGREFRAESANATLVARVLAGDRRLYQIAIVGSKGSIAPAGVETFFASFRLVQPAPVK